MTIHQFFVTGVGVFFERDTHDGSWFPIVKDVTQKGSASREGSIKSGELLLSVDGRSCRDLSLTDLRSLVWAAYLLAHISVLFVTNIFGSIGLK